MLENRGLVSGCTFWTLVLGRAASLPLIAGSSATSLRASDIQRLHRQQAPPGHRNQSERGAMLWLLQCNMTERSPSASIRNWIIP
jgi:hypothetical protein